MESLTAFSGALAGVVDAAAPSVVRVEARGRRTASGTVWAADGLIVTADHVIEQEDGIRVGLADGTVVSAQVVGRDASTDVAVLRAEAGGLAAAIWGDASPLRAGHLVLALARPGRAIRAALGIVNAAADDWRAPGGARLDRYVQVDAALQPGFSGGPVVDASGTFIGLTTSGLLRRTALAVPPQTLRRVVETLVAHGRVRQGYLGIAAQPVRLPAAARQSLGLDAGLIVLSVEPGSPADRAGLVLGDVLVDVGGVDVRHHGDLRALLSEERIGQTLSARILRGGDVRQVPVVVGERG